MKNIVNNLILLLLLVFTTNISNAAVSYENQNQTVVQSSVPESPVEVKNKKAKFQKNKKGKVAQKNKPTFEILPNGWLPAGIVLILIGAVMALFGGLIAILGAVFATIGLGFIIYWIIREVRRPY